MTDRLRERKWVHVERVRAWHARLHERRPRAARVFDSILRSALRAYARFELPRCVGLLETAIVAFPAAWPHKGVRECRGCWHGYRLRLDLSDYFQRWAYVLRRYHDVPLQLLIWRAARRGDTVIDGGANHGLVSLVAAWRVGPGGRVYAFEPNPVVHEQVRWHIEANRLSHLVALPLGLGDREETLELRVPGQGNLGAGTFSPVPGRYQGEVSQRCEARIARGDAIAELKISGEPIIKLDVEGFELRALRGLEQTIRRYRPLVITEMNAEMLAMAGTSPGELFAFFADRGYRPFEFFTRRAIIRHRRLVLRSIDPASERLPLDVAWVHPESVFEGRLSRYMEGPPAGRAQRQSETPPASPPANPAAFPEHPQHESGHTEHHQPHRDVAVW